MIEILITFVLLIILVEILIFIQKKSAKNDPVDLALLDFKLEIIRSLSYLPAKRKDLETFAREISDIILSKKEYSSFKLMMIDNGDYKIVFESSGGESHALSSQVTEYLETLQTNEITSSLGMIIIPVYYQLNKIGYILLTGNNNLNDDERNCLKVLVGTLTLIIRGINFSKKLSNTDQLKAVSKKW